MSITKLMIALLTCTLSISLFGLADFAEAQAEEREQESTAFVEIDDVEISDRALQSLHSSVDEDEGIDAERFVGWLAENLQISARGEADAEGRFFVFFVQPGDTIFSTSHVGIDMNVRRGSASVGDLVSQRQLQQLQRQFDSASADRFFPGDSLFPGDHLFPGDSLSEDDKKVSSEQEAVELGERAANQAENHVGNADFGILLVAYPAPGDWQPQPAMGFLPVATPSGSSEEE